jgi:hypothetical protein
MGTSLGAQESKPTVVPETRPRVERPTDYKVPLITQAVSLDDFADMEPRPGLQKELTEIAGFTEKEPNNGTPATERTDVWLGHTRTALYVVFVCHDHRPALMRGHLARRENILTDDYVSVLLDPFQDRRKGVLFAMNPAGVQADAAWTEGNRPDYSYDQVWQSEARTTQHGWLALFAIPFQSLRFRPGTQGWGVVFQRNLPRNSETDTWPAISSNISGTLSQEGTLQGIEGITGSHNVQINPYALAQNEHTLNSLDPMQPYFSTRRLEGTVGGDIKAIVDDSIVLDATINPDFSQVESDQPQFTVNQRYPVYFPELRPFFLENANYFATPINLLYTRNIVHPEFGGRATGKVGNTNLGILAIDDRQPGEGGSTNNPLYKKRAFYGVGRISQDIGKNSSIGAMYTDQELAGSSNRVGGIDFTARINDKWTATGQFVESSTKALDGTYSAGPASTLEFTRNGRGLSLDNTYSDFSTGFQSQSGFIQTNNIRQDSNHFSYRWYPKKPGIIQSYVLEENHQVAWNHQGNRLYRYVSDDIAFLLSRNTIIAPIFQQNSDTLTPANYSSLTQTRNFAENQLGFVFRSAPVRQLSFNIVSFYGGNVNYNPVAGAPPSLLHQNFLQALVTIQPLAALTIDNTYLLDRDRAAADGSFALENQTMRTKINYQFTRAFSARVIVEYDSLLANPLKTSLTRTKQVATQALLTWLPHPGTAIYVGYNSDLQNLDHAFCSQLAGFGCDPHQPILARSPHYLNDGRQFFVKASYLLRF